MSWKVDKNQKELKTIADAIKKKHSIMGTEFGKRRKLNSGIAANINKTYTISQDEMKNLNVRTISPQPSKRTN